MTNSKDICLLFGGNHLNTGVLDKFHKWGCDVVVVDWNEHPAIVGGRHLRLDVKDPGPIIAALEKEGLKSRVRTGFTSIDVAVPSLAAVLKECGLLVNTEKGLANCFSKSRQTEVWRNAGLLNRESRKFEKGDATAVDAVTNWNASQKLIVKPDNAASSRGITILERESSAKDVACALQKAFDGSTNGIAVAEEFVEGTEFTVEMLGDSHGHVGVYAISKKQHTKNTDRNKIAVKLHYNAVSGELQRKIAEYAIRCYKALGFSCSFGHLEILLKPDGTISPVEIGARSSGYIASDLVDIVSGRDYLGDLYRVQQGGEVQDGLLPQTDRSSMYYFYDIPGGSVVRRDCRIMDFMDSAITSRRSWKSDGFAVGATIQNIDNDNARLGLEILEGPRSLMTEEYVLKCENDMLQAMVEPG